MSIPASVRVRPGSKNNETDSLEKRIEELEEACKAILKAIRNIEDTIDAGVIESGEYLGEVFE